MCSASVLCYCPDSTAPIWMRSVNLNCHAKLPLVKATLQASPGCKVICGSIYFQSLGGKRCAALFGTESLARMIGAVEKGRMTAPRIGFAFCIQIVLCWFHLWISCDRVSTFAAFGLHWSAVGSVTKPRFRRWMLRLFWRSSRQSKAFLTAT